MYAGSATDAGRSTVWTVSAKPCAQFPTLAALHCRRTSTCTSWTAAYEWEGLCFLAVSKFLPFWVQQSVSSGLGLLPHRGLVPARVQSRRCYWLSSRLELCDGQLHLPGIRVFWACKAGPQILLWLLLLLLSVEDRLRNDLYCVGWGVKLCSTSTYQFSEKSPRLS